MDDAEEAEVLNAAFASVLKIKLWPDTWDLF